MVVTVSICRLLLSAACKEFYWHYVLLLLFLFKTTVLFLFATLRSLFSSSILLLKTVCSELSFLKESLKYAVKGMILCTGLSLFVRVIPLIMVLSSSFYVLLPFHLNSKHYNPPPPRKCSSSLILSLYFLPILYFIFHILTEIFFS